VATTGPTRRALAAVAVAGCVTGLAAAAITLMSDHPASRGPYPFLALAIGWGFIGAGLLAMWRRPANRAGLLMTVVGFAWFLASLSGSNVQSIHTVGLFFAALWGGFAVHGLLAFPSGRLESKSERLVVATAYFHVTVLQALPLLFGGGSRGNCPECPKILAGLSSNDRVADALLILQRAVVVVLGLGLCAALFRRWRRSAAPQRRALAPSIWCGGATAALVGLAAASDSGDRYTLSGPLDWAWLVTLACVPFAFLAGVLRSRLHRGGAVSELVERLGEARGPGELRDALSTALGDPSLSLAYWLPDQERYVDGSGRPVELPNASSGHASTDIRHGGRPVAAIVHDNSLDEEPELVRTAGAAASLSLENERLDAELRARLEELRASRARLVEAGDAERRRIERDLHDGAQQRLVSLLLNLKLARRKTHNDEEQAAVLLDQVEAEVRQALSELRTLASGILPPVLSDRGLAAAVEELTSRSPVPVEIEQMPAERLPERVEVAAYFVVAEALTNVAKHAAASKASVGVAKDDGRALVEVSDDGLGGVKLEDGSGLRGLADRVGALEGRLELDSPTGRGTTLRVEIPCA